MIPVCRGKTIYQIITDKMFLFSSFNEIKAGTNVDKIMNQQPNSWPALEVCVDLLSKPQRERERLNKSCLCLSSHLHECRYDATPYDISLSYL